jgi:hypothetical protein
MLDDHSWVVPYIEVWTSEKLPWAATAAARSYPTQPEFPEYEGLIGQYAERGSRPA